MGPLIVASTLMLILAVGVTVALAGALAAEPRLLDWAGLHARLSQSVRRACLIPLGFVAFAIVTSGQIQGQGVGGAPSMRVEQGLPRGDRMTEDMVTRIVTQGGAVAVLLVVLWSYRRDFFRKLEDKERELQERRDEKDTLQDVLDRSSTAITNSVNATTNQTTATHRLARTVENIEREIKERRQSGGHA